MTTTIKLQYPVLDEATATEYTDLQMRRCKVKDRRLASKQKTNEDVEIALIAMLCEVTPAVIEELDAADYTEVQKVLAGFLGTTMPA